MELSLYPSDCVTLCYAQQGLQDNNCSVRLVCIPSVESPPVSMKPGVKRTCQTKEG